MHERLSIPTFANTLGDFAADLRSWTFSSQSKAGQYFGLDHTTVLRYENGIHTPKLGYLAALARLLVERIETEGTPSPADRTSLLQELNKVVYLCYPDDKPFEDWGRLCQMADSYCDGRNRTPQKEKRTRPRIEDWGEAPNIAGFHGRTQELSDLTRWVLTDHCRVVGVFGTGGIGKTALATRLALSVQDDFEIVLWRSLRNAPPLEVLLDDLLQRIHGRPAGSAEHGERQVELLLDYFRLHRTLLVLDNVETIMGAGEPAGSYREGYANYGDLFARIADSVHVSCLVLTSRDTPADLTMVNDTPQRVQAIRIEGLSLADARAVLSHRKLTGTEAAWARLVETYSGNPLALRIAAETILDLYNGDIDAFVREGVPIFGDILGFLTQQFRRLSALEQDILFWLAIEREAVSAEDLNASLVSPAGKRSVIEALNSLRRRSLIEPGDAGFTLQNFILEYLTDQLIDDLVQEVVDAQSRLLNSHALIKTQSKEYLRQSQVRLLIEPLAHRLLGILGSQPALIDHLMRLLAAYRQSPPVRGYAAGNILNLLGSVRAEIAGSDFSSLSIWQADLRNLDLHDASFVRADFANTLFIDTFGRVIFVAFSPDGRWLAAATIDNEVRLFETHSGQLAQIFQGHTDWVRTVKFSPDGKSLVSGSDDQTLRLWDVATGRCLKTLRGHGDRVRCVAISPDGRLIASSSDDTMVRLWEPVTGQCLATLQGHTSLVSAVVFSPDGQTLASSDFVARLWSVASRECWRQIDSPNDRVWSLVFTPDGKSLAGGCDGGALRLWDIDTGKETARIGGHSGVVWSIACSPDGETLASAGDDQAIRLWHLRSRRLLHTWNDHQHRVLSVAFSPDGKALASGGADQSVRLWQVATREPIRTWQGYRSRVSTVAFSPSGLVLASGGDDQKVRLWDATNWSPLHSMIGHAGRLSAVTFSPDSLWIASGSDDQTVRVWETETGSPIHVLHGHEASVESVAFSPDGRSLASGSDDGTIRLWDSHSGTCRRVLSGHTDWVRTAVFSPDSRLVATASDDLTIRLWNASTGNCVAVLTGHTNWPFCLAVSPDGLTLASGSADQTVCLWDIQSGRCLRTFEGHSDIVRSVAFSPDGLLLASTGADRTVRLWDVQGETHRILPQRHTDRVWSLSFSPFGDVLASGSEDETIILWHLPSDDWFKTLRADRPYERMDIAGATGLTEAQTASLRAIGAVSAASLFR